MTSNQIAYLQAVEAQRANQARESETHRANIANELRQERLAEAEVEYKAATTAKSLAEERDRRLNSAVTAFATTGETSALKDVLEELNIRDDEKLAWLERLKDLEYSHDQVSAESPITFLMDALGVSELANAFGGVAKGISSLAKIK